MHGLHPSPRERFLANKAVVFGGQEWSGLPREPSAGMRSRPVAAAFALCERESMSPIGW